MNKETLNATWDQFRLKYGIYLRLIEALPEDQLHGHPIAGMRTPAEMIAHVSGSMVREFAIGVRDGEIKSDEKGESAVAAGFKNRAAAIAFAHECWDLASEAVSEISDDELNAIVGTPFGMSFPGYVGINILNDEFMHHRGQLTAYARACGVEPPFVYGFADNAPEFQPAG